MGFEVDWATTALLLVSRLEGEILRRDPISDESAQFMQIAPYATMKQGVSQSKLSSLSTTPTDSKFCPPKVQLGSTSRAADLAAEVAIAEEVLNVEAKLMANIASKELFLKSSKSSISDKFIAFKFGMDDREADAREVADNVKTLQESLDTCNLKILEVEKRVRFFEYHFFLGDLVLPCLHFVFIFPSDST
jgi:hypothetical protein